MYRSAPAAFGFLRWKYPGQSRYCIAGFHDILALFDEMFSVALWRCFVGVRGWAAPYVGSRLLRDLRQGVLWFESRAFLCLLTGVSGGLRDVSRGACRICHARECRGAIPLLPPLRDHFRSFACGAEPPSLRMTSGACVARKMKVIHELLLPCTLRSVPPWQMPQLSKKPASSSLRYWRVSSTLKCTPSPGVSHTSMNPSLTIGEGRPSRTSYHQEGSPVEYSNAM